MSNKFTCPPQASGQGSFSDNLVGFQLVDGGGFTQGNFEFTTNIVEKQDRNFIIGSFSDPMSLESMNIRDVEDSKLLVANNFQIYPNYDLSRVTNFTLYGSLRLRFSNSITRIINYFPAALDVQSTRLDFSQGNTGENITYDKIDDETEIDVLLSSIRNPFGIDYSTNADRNINALEINVSDLRNFKNNFNKYSVFINDEEYKINDIVATSPNSTYLKLYLNGNPFPGLQIVTGKH